MSRRVPEWMQEARRKRIVEGLERAPRDALAARVFFENGNSEAAVEHLLRAIAAVAEVAEIAIEVERDR